MSKGYESALEAAGATVHAFNWTAPTNPRRFFNSWSMRRANMSYEDPSSDETKVILLAGLILIFVSVLLS